MLEIRSLSHLLIITTSETSQEFCIWLIGGAKTERLIILIVDNNLFDPLRIPLSFFKVKGFSLITF